MSEYTSILQDIQHWFNSLPPDVATMRVYAPDNDPSAIHITIRPLKNTDAAAIGIRINKHNGFVDLWAGEGFAVDEAYWPNLPVVDICQAIVTGGLTEEVRYWKGRVTGSKWSLQLQGQEETGNDIDVWDDFWRLILGKLVGRRETRIVHHPAYYTTEVVDN